MTLRLAWRALAAQPVRSLVLAGGFGMGIAAMAGLLGIGEVILEQSRSPVLEGGGDVMITGINGRVSSARFLLTRLTGGTPLGRRVAVAAPTSSATLYLVEEGRAPQAVLAKGVVPSAQRELGEAAPESWVDAPADADWARPDPGDVLRSLDRFHRIPDAPEYSDSWAEWLYFNARDERSGTRFYLTFLAGPAGSGGTRRSGVRLQLDSGGRLRAYSDTAELADVELLERAPDIAIGRSFVQLSGLSYRIHLELYKEDPDGDQARRPPRRPRAPDLTADLELEAVPGRSLPPLQVRGARGWVSGYVVPVLSGTLSGTLSADGERIDLDRAAGYHDHNWGFWRGVTWQWGQVARDDISLLYGRVRPPSDAADPDRLPAFLMALGPGGALGYTTAVRIEEVDDPVTGRPEAIRVEADGPDLRIEMELTVQDAVSTPFRGGPLGGGAEPAPEFLQLRSTYRVKGVVGDRRLDFTAVGAAETFRKP